MHSIWSSHQDLSWFDWKPKPAQERHLINHMNKKMIMAGLAARPVRTTVSILAVALEVALILIVVGLTTGISEETAKRTEGVGADIMFQPPNSSLFLAINNATMPLALEAKIR